jgi:hypothetical protein
MHSSLPKQSSVSSTLLCLFTFTTAASLPTYIARNCTAIYNRQASNGIFYDNSCDTLKGKLQQLYPKACILTLYQKKNDMPKGYTWDTILYIFGINYDLIGYGYAPSDANLGNTWFSMASQLPCTVDNNTHNNVPALKYATQHYNGKSMGSYVEEWNKNNSGIDAHHWQFIFDFA